MTHQNHQQRTILFPIRKLLLISGIILALMSTALHWSEAKTEESELVVLALGSAIQLPLAPGSTLAIENESIISTEEEESSSAVRISARSKGSTLLRHWSDEKPNLKKEITIIVLGKEEFEAFREVKTLLRDVEGIDVRPMGGEIVISGEVLLFKDAALIEEIAQKEKKVVVTTTVSPLAFQTAAEQINRAFIANHLPHLKATVAGKGIVITGEVPTEREKEIALDLAKNMAHPIVDSLKVSFSDSPLISLEIAILELHRSQALALGLEWPSALMASGAIELPGSSSSFGFQGSPVDIETFIAMVQTKGVGKIISSPHLSCRSGEEAQFFSGGQIPIETKSYKSHEVSWKPHGVTLTIKPKANQNGLIATHISAEVSSLFANNRGNSNIPELSIRKIDTALTVASGATVLLGGLLSEQQNETTRKVPVLSSIPLLGLLFQSQTSSHEAKELLIAVTPRVVEEEMREHHVHVSRLRDQMDATMEKKNE